MTANTGADPVTCCGPGLGGRDNGGDLHLGASMSSALLPHTAHVTGVLTTQGVLLAHSQLWKCPRHGGLLCAGPWFGAQRHRGGREMSKEVGPKETSGAWRASQEEDIQGH